MRHQGTAPDDGMRGQRCLDRIRIERSLSVIDACRAAAQQPQAVLLVETPCIPGPVPYLFAQAELGVCVTRSTEITRRDVGPRDDDLAGLPGLQCVPFQRFLRFACTRASPAIAQDA